MRASLIFVGMMTALAASAAEKADIRPDMHAFAAEITTLQKFLLTDADFAAPANEAAIRKSLASLEGHLEHLGTGAFANDPALKVNYGLLQHHIKDANRVFREGGKSFARYMVQSSLQLCIACHTRKKAADFAWPDVEAKDIPQLDKADYLFATRQFKRGVEVYESVAAGFPANRVGQAGLRKALLALAVYYARVAESPKDGARFFGEASARDDFPLYLREELGAWAKEFTAWSKEKPVKGASTEMALLARAKKLLRNDDLSLVSSLDRSFHVRRLRASSLLQAVLESPGEKSPTKAEALLYLGQIYPRLSSSVFFRFGEMYLKACITDYPHTKTARSCYVALELNVSEGYTGTAGTDIPADEQAELHRLKRLAY